MLARERHKLILELLKKDGTVRTADLVETMSVSSETVRKDLDFLEQAGQLERVHGGAVPVPKKLVAEPMEEYVSLAARNTQHMGEKSRIVHHAAGLIREKQVVALDYGSTSFLMAKELARRFRSLTVITNSVQNALALVKCPDFTIILVGGILNKEELSLGNDFSAMLDSLHIDVLFMSVSGVHPTVGLTDQGFSEARVQNQMRQLGTGGVALHHKFLQRTAHFAHSFQARGGVNNNFGYHGIIERAQLASVIKRRVHTHTASAGKMQKFRLSR